MRQQIQQLHSISLSLDFIHIHSSQHKKHFIEQLLLWCSSSNTYTTSIDRSSTHCFRQL